MPDGKPGIVGATTFSVHEINKNLKSQENIDPSRITPKQCAAARALLGWTQRQLAEVASVNETTVILFESGKRNPIPATMKAMIRALQEGGIVFIPPNGGGPGVRQRDP
jgi:DNA-binding XRE family transcriptional regulator